MNSRDFPGIIWVFILIGLPMLAEWIPQNFGWTAWAAPVAGLILIVVKVFEVYRAQSKLPDTAESAPMQDVQRGKTRSILLG